MKPRINNAQLRMIERIAPWAEVDGRLIEPVLEVMRNTPREQFLDSVWQFQAYEEKNLPLGGNNLTISLPSVVCQMTSLLYAHSQHDSILEIGTGSGYQSAILCRLWQQVYTIERVKSLSLKAQRVHQKHRLDNIQYAIADGCLGWQPHRQFAAIMLTAAVGQVPQILLEQLQLGGFLVAPIGDTEQQTLVLYRRQATKRFSQRSISQTLFVPMLEGLE